MSKARGGSLAHYRGPPSTHHLFASLLELTGTVSPRYPVRVLRGVCGTDSHGRRGSRKGAAWCVQVHMQSACGEGEHPAASQSCGSPREPPGGVEYGRNIITTGFSEWGG